MNFKDSRKAEASCKKAADDHANEDYDSQVVSICNVAASEKSDRIEKQEQCVQQAELRTFCLLQYLRNQPILLAKPGLHH